MSNNLKVLAVLVLVTAQGPSFAATEASQKTESTFPTPASVTSHEAQKMHMGLNLGLNSPDGNYDSTLGFGLDVGFQPYIPFGVGAEVFTTQMDRENRNGNDQRTAFLAKGTYNLGGDIPLVRHSYAGLAAGPVLTGDTWDIGVAPLVGFDIPVTKMGERDLTLGANVKYLMTSSDTADSFMSNLAIKYWY